MATLALFCRRTILFAIIALGGFTIAGCAGNTESPRYTHSEATVKVEKYVRDATATLQPPPRLEFRRPLLVPCSDDNDFDRPGPAMVMTERSGWLRVPDMKKNAKIFDQIFAHWLAQGFKIDRDSGPQPFDEVRFAVASNSDGFTMTLSQSRGGALSINAQSPCVLDPTP
jgi:hypothetical protein